MTSNDNLKVQLYTKKHKFNDRETQIKHLEDKLDRTTSEIKENNNN